MRPARPRSSRPCCPLRLKVFPALPLSGRPIHHFPLLSLSTSRSKFISWPAALRRPLFRRLPIPLAVIRRPVTRSRGQRQQQGPSAPRLPGRQQRRPARLSTSTDVQYSAARRKDSDPAGHPHAPHHVARRLSGSRSAVSQVAQRRRLPHRSSRSIKRSVSSLWLI